MRAHVRLLSLLLLLPTLAAAQNNVPPQLMYMTVTRSMRILSVCELATPARQEWLDHLMGHAKKKIAFLSDADKAKLDAELATALANEFPRKPPKEFCAEFVKGLDAERKTVIRD